MTEIINDRIGHPNFYAILPATVRYDKNLSDKAKLLYAEITALGNAEGYCLATNRYFAKRFACSKTTIIRNIKELEEHGYVTCEILKGSETNEITGRKIYIIKGNN